MPEPLDDALTRVRSLLLAPERLVRAVAGGRRRGTQPSLVRAELRPVLLKSGPHVQVVTNDGSRPLVRNVAPGPVLESMVDSLLAEPFGNWHVETVAQTVQLRVTKRGAAQVHVAPTTAGRPCVPESTSFPAAAAANGVDADSNGAIRSVDAGSQRNHAGVMHGRFGVDEEAGPAPALHRNQLPDRPKVSDSAGLAGAGSDSLTGMGRVHVVSGPVGLSSGGEGSVAEQTHDRRREHLLAPDDPLFDVIGGNAAKRRQVDAFLRALAATVSADDTTGPMRVIDLGCGNAYLTFAAYRYLSGLGREVLMTGVDVREDQRDRNTVLAARLGWGDRVRFVAGTIADVTVDGADLVLALHACDTATDEALARAVGWQARWVLAAPCCHQDLAAQLRRAGPPDPYRLLTRHGILRERLADVLTDALRAAMLRLHGYRVDVVEFIDSSHTPRNLLLKATRTGAPPTTAQRAEYEELTSSWTVTPHLEVLLGLTGHRLSGSGRSVQREDDTDARGGKQDATDNPADK